MGGPLEGPPRLVSSLGKGWEVAVSILGGAGKGRRAGVVGECLPIGQDTCKSWKSVINLIRKAWTWPKQCTATLGSGRSTNGNNRLYPTSSLSVLVSTAMASPTTDEDAHDSTLESRKTPFPCVRSRLERSPPTEQLVVMSRQLPRQLPAQIQGLTRNWPAFSPCGVPFPHHGVLSSTTGSRLAQRLALDPPSPWIGRVSASNASCSNFCTSRNADDLTVRKGMKRTTDYDDHRPSIRPRHVT